MTTPSYLPNPVFAALNTADAPFALVGGRARRFEAEVIPFAAVSEPSAEALADLLPLLARGEEIYLTAGEGELIPPVRGLEAVSMLRGLQMRLISAPPADDGDSRVVRLTSDDTDDMVELKARAFPGFFGPRAPELGCFFGIRDPETARLVAMGGERLATYAEREVSAVCTDPEHVGRGYAARLVRAVIRHQAQLGVCSFLHVSAANERAISLYKYLGFAVTGRIDFVKLRRV